MQFQRFLFLIFLCSLKNLCKIIFHNYSTLCQILYFISYLFYFSYISGYFLYFSFVKENGKNIN
ncbi:hypothetical protein BY996DRAFT_8239610, partial [Phakopsora pachyrhizi]